jgi:hypothetical protein
MTQVGSRRLTADIFADSHRISTQMALRGRVLSDVLNDTSTSYLELDIAYVSRIDHPGEILADYALSIVRKDRLSFVVIASGLEMALKQNRPPHLSPPVAGFTTCLTLKSPVRLRRRPTSICAR